MSGAESVLAVVSAVNAVVTLAAQIGVSMQQLAQAQQQAALEGREFGIDDVIRIKEQAEKALERLNAAIEKAQQPQ